MKNLEQVQREEKIGTVYTTEKFAECIRRGSFNSFDGVGFFHDGEQETDKCVWDYWELQMLGHQDINVLAYMELPEPYKGVTE